MSRWHECDIADVALEFGTDVNNGRSDSAKDKKRRGNNNVFLLPSADSKTVLKQLLSDASFILLAVTYLIAAFMGHLYESISGILIIIAVFIFGFIIKYSSAKRISNSYRMLLPVSKVIVNGTAVRLSVFDVEVGDLISFSHGDIIPANARLVSAANLTVAQRYINSDTGKVEYERVDKSPDPVFDTEDMRSTYKSMVYAGSMVIAGKGSAIVTETASDPSFNRIALVPSNDVPGYLRSFFKSTKRISLAVFFSVIPVTFAALAAQTANTSPLERTDLLYLFLIMLSLSVTCMSEIAVAPAETLVTKEILISSRSNKAKRITESRITKLSAAERLADTDTVLILSPEVLLDTRNMVRMVFFADKQYRFDTLRSDDLDCFFETISPIFKYTQRSNMSTSMRSVKDFLSENTAGDESVNASAHPRFLKNYPISGARSCVFKANSQGIPISYIAHTTDLSLIDKCGSFRTEGGGKWKMDQKVYSDISEIYQEYTANSLNVQIFVSSDSVESGLIFEGMVAVGKEYPFGGGELSEEFSVSGIQPVLVIDDENDDNINLALGCGLINDMREVAIASEYRKNGISVIDAPLTTRAYVGFGPSAVAEIADRLNRNGKNVLPIIKDSTDRRSISPLSVYATHATDSYDSVRISSSLSLQPADSVAHDGGLLDTLKMIRGSSMARLKVGIYKNYLAFSMFLRIVAVCAPLLIGNPSMIMTTLMILLSGFVCDGIALSSLMFAKGIPVKPKNSASDAKTLFSSALFIFFAIAGAVSAFVSLIIASSLLSVGILTDASASLFLMYCVFAVQIAALGGFLVTLNKRARRKAFNWFYLISAVLFVGILLVQSKLPEAFFHVAKNAGIYRIAVNLLPYIGISAAVGLASVLLISKLLTVFSSSKNI